MTTIKTGKGEFLAVEVPEDAHSFVIDGELFYKAGYMWFKDIGMIKLPPGQWSFVCVSKGISEEDAGKIVEMQRTFGYRNYKALNGDYQWVSNGLKSFSSLLKHYGLDENTNYAILKKE